MLRSVEYATLRSLMKVAILDSSAAVVRMKKIRPRDVHQNNESLCFEFRQGVIKDFYCGERGLLGFGNEFRTD